MASSNNNSNNNTASHHWWTEPEEIMDDDDHRNSRRRKEKDDVEEALKPRRVSSKTRSSSGGRNQQQYLPSSRRSNDSGDDESHKRNLISKSSSGGISNSSSKGSRGQGGTSSSSNSNDRNKQHHSRKPSSSASSSSRNKNAPPPSSSSSSKPIPVSKHSRDTSHGSNQSKGKSIGRVSSHSTSSSSLTSSSSSNKQKSKKAFNESLTGIDTKKSQKRLSSTGSTSGSSQASSTRSNQSVYRKYTIKELIQSLGAIENHNDAGSEALALPPAMERRVRDFKFAQTKRRERHGENKPWGIWGLYEHLSDIRADLEWAEDAAWRRQNKHPYLSWSDYVKAHKGANNRPWFTYGIIGLCSIMVIVTIGVNGWKFEPLNVNPLIGPSAETLVKCGARETDLIVNEGQWFRLFTPMILHAGIVHYVINMMAMWFIGGAVEQSHGSMSAAVLFCVPAVGGNILSALCLPQYISVGASGGIFGLIGGCAADIAINWDLLFLKTTTDENTRYRHFMVLFWLGLDILVNCLIGLTPLVDNFTHLGGFLYGLFCGLSTIERLAVGFFGIHSGKYAKQMNLLMRFGGLIASVLSIMVTTILLSNSDGLTSPCHGCRYISCVPFPPGSEDKWWHCDDCDFVTADLFVAANGSGLYELVELHCPNGDVESIPVSAHNLTDREDVRGALPGYCRAHCEHVFKKHF